MRLGVEARADWAPLVRGAASERIWTIVDDILAELPSRSPTGPGLAGGHAGLALMYAYVGLCCATRRSLAWTRAREHLDLAQARIVVADPSLFTGASGVGWVSDHLDRRLAGASLEQDTLNAALVSSVAAGVPGYDLAQGRTGVLLYALSQSETESGRRLVAAIVQSLWTTRETDPHETWLTPPTALDAEVRREYPFGIYNLGLAHGTPGAISVLSRVRGGAETEARAAALLRTALDDLFARRRPDAQPEFPYWVSVDQQKLRAGPRVAWCYGDLGVAMALLMAGRRAGAAGMCSAAVELALRTVEQARGAADGLDAMLCHGAMGHAHLYNRLFFATGEPRFRDAALEWLDRTLALCRRGEGIAGFAAAVAPHGGDGRASHPVPGFLTGAAGLVLGLLAFVTELEPAWDAVLLADVQAPGPGLR